MANPEFIWKGPSKGPSHVCQAEQYCTGMHFRHISHLGTSAGLQVQYFIHGVTTCRDMLLVLQTTAHIQSPRLQVKAENLCGSADNQPLLCDP